MRTMLIRTQPNESTASLLQRWHRALAESMVRPAGMNHFCPGASGSGEWCHRSEEVPSLCAYCEEPNYPKPPEALMGLKVALQEDEGYAWSWHCAISMACQDEGVDKAVADRIGARLMSQAFGIDMTKSSLWGR